MSIAIEQTIGGLDSVEARELRRAARATLRAQLARMERRLSGLQVRGFPHVHPAAARTAGSAPALLGLAELERARDDLASRIAEAERQLAERSRRQRDARELLRRALLEPGRYKFLRIPVTELGLGTCGAWEVRPRLGPIGMLAGWWQVKLSSGCP
ncbi:MAG TPA: hypothetical protein VFW38_04960 [Solirubrobacteraceae bacterium]|nr:hypothetical protein [Solirubrobacteraceae bacterium]